MAEDNGVRGWQMAGRHREDARCYGEGNKPRGHKCYQTQKAGMVILKMHGGPPFSSFSACRRVEDPGEGRQARVPPRLAFSIRPFAAGCLMRRRPGPGGGEAKVLTEALQLPMSRLARLAAIAVGRRTRVLVRQ